MMRKASRRPSFIRLFLARHWKLFLWGAVLVVLCIYGARHHMAEKITFLLADLRRYKETVAIKSIDIEGASRANEPIIRQAFHCQIGDSLFCGSLNKVKALPFIGDATIARQLTSQKIIIHVDERNPYAVWQNHGEFSLIDRDGQIIPDRGFDDKERLFFARLPLVVGNDANKGNTSLIDTLLALPNLKAHIVAAIKINDRRWDLQLRNGTRIFLPENKEEAALRYLDQLDNQTAILDRPVQWIDLRLPDRVTVKKREMTAPATADENTQKAEPAPSPQKPKTSPSEATQNKAHIVHEDIVEDTTGI